MLLDTASIFGKHPEISTRVLSPLFENGDFSFQGVLVHIEKLVLAKLREFLGLLLLTKLAEVQGLECWISEKVVRYGPDAMQA